MGQQLTLDSFLKRAAARGAVRLNMQKLRAQRRALGLCQCGDQPLPGRRRCARCKVADDHANAMRPKRG